MNAYRKRTPPENVSLEEFVSMLKADKKAQGTIHDFDNFIRAGAELARRADLEREERRVRAQLKREFVEFLDQQQRVRDASGVPEDARDLVQRIPPLPAGGQDASGDQAERAQHQVQPGGGAALGPGSGNSTLAASATASLNGAAADERDDKARQYIGASAIGEECIAALALALRGFPNDPPTPQQRRIFRDGHRIEQTVLADLERARIQVSAIDPETGRQWTYRVQGGHLRASLDGRMETRTVEIKSMNADMFEKFRKKGLAVSHPEYVDQVQMGMGFSGLTECLFVAYCKNNSTYHVEVIPFDAQRFARLQARAAEAMFGEPRRISANEREWRCMQCFKRTACWKGVMGTEVFDRSDCSACAHAIPDVVSEGQKWFCKLHGQPAEHKCGDFKTFKVVPIAGSK